MAFCGIFVIGRLLVKEEEKVIKTSNLEQKNLEEYLDKYLAEYLENYKNDFILGYEGIIYARLSQEEMQRLRKNNQTFSSSITSQVEMLLDASAELKIKIVKICIDDGYTGQRFEDRPGFQEMRLYLDSNKANLVITKNISRLGRDFIDTCTYFQRYFPQKNIRYIAYLDEYDSLKDDPTDERWLEKMKQNDTFSRTISKNVKSGRRARARSGLYMGTYAPFGYKKDPNDRNKLLIDDATAEIVRRMFKLSADGMSSYKIAKIFDEEKIPRPSEFIGNIHTKKDDLDNGWRAAVIHRILKNELYLGHLIQGKSKKESYKSKKMISVEKDKWIRKENMHESIIDEQTFKKSQEMILSRSNTRTRTYDWILKGLIKCKECKRKLSILPYTNKSGKKTLYLRCNTYAASTHSGLCTPHTNNLEKVTESILISIKNICKKYVEDVNYKMLISNNEEKIKKFEYSREEQIKVINKEIKILNDKIMRAFETKINGLLTNEDYERVYEKYNNQRILLKGNLEKIHEQDENKQNIYDVDKIIREFASVEEITRDMLVKLVDRIEISENKEIDIYYKFSILNN